MVIYVLFLKKASQEGLNEKKTIFTARITVRSMCTLQSVATGQRELDNKTFCSCGFPQSTLINNGATIQRDKIHVG